MAAVVLMTSCWWMTAAARRLYYSNVSYAHSRSKATYVCLFSYLVRELVTYRTGFIC